MQFIRKIKKTAILFFFCVMVPFQTSEASIHYIQSSLKQILSQYSKEILTTFSACLTVAIVSFLAFLIKKRRELRQTRKDLHTEREQHKKTRTEEARLKKLLKDEQLESDVLCKLLKQELYANTELQKELDQVTESADALVDELRRQQLEFEEGEHFLEENEEKLRKELDLVAFQRNQIQDGLKRVKTEHQKRLEGLPSITEHYFSKAGLIGRDLGESYLDQSMITGNKVQLSVLLLSKNELPGLIEVADEHKEQYNGYKILRRTVKPSWKNNGKALLVCVHGTFADDKSFGADESKQTTQGIIVFAKKLARLYGCSIDILSLAWSGACDYRHRKEAGRVLAHNVLLPELEENDIDKIWMIGHSYGCAVLNYAADIIRIKKDRAIDYGVFMASPISTDIPRLNEPETPQKLVSTDNTYNFKQLFQFYSPDDATQIAASVSGGGGSRRKLPVCIAYDKKNGGRLIWNVRLQVSMKEKDSKKVQCKGVDHVNIKLFTLLALPELLANIETFYLGHYDLDAMIKLKKDQNGIVSLVQDEMPLVAIRREEITCQEYLEKKGIPNVLALGLLAQSKQRSERVKRVFEDTYNRKMSAKNGGGFWEYVPRNPLRIAWNELLTAQNDTI